MKRSLMVGLLVVLISINSSAQGLYKLQYYGSYNYSTYNNGTYNYVTYNVVYDALLSWYGPGLPSTMRIKYNDPTSQTSVLVEQNIFFIPQPGGFMLRGANARFIHPAAITYPYYPDSFMFGACPNGTFPCVGTIDDAGQVAALTEFRPVFQAEAGALLQTFGFLSVNPSVNNPPVNSIPNTARTSTSRVTMHLVVAADTDDPEIGVNDQIDANGIVREFRIAADEIGIRFNPILISGNSFSRSAILNTLNGLNPDSNDIVVFAYSGHGFRLDSDTDPYPRMNLATNRRDPSVNNLAASEVFGLLKRKGSRLNITLIDACNGRLRQSKLRAKSGSSLKDAASGISRNAVATLFLNTRGNIIVAAASRGELATTDKDSGGYFTRSFLNAFRAETSLVFNSTPSWRSIIANTDKAALQISYLKQNVVYHIE